MKGIMRKLVKPPSIVLTPSVRRRPTRSSRNAAVKLAGISTTDKRNTLKKMFAGSLPAFSDNA